MNSKLIKGTIPNRIFLSSIKYAHQKTVKMKKEKKDHNTQTHDVVLTLIQREMDVVATSKQSRILTGYIITIH